MCQIKKIFRFVARILAPLCYHKRKYGKSKPADYSEKVNSGEEKQTNMVHNHGNSGNYF